LHSDVKKNMKEGGSRPKNTSAPVVAPADAAIRHGGLPVATLKQFAAGNGHLQKLEMAPALVNQ
jgi:hypothetical protein